MISWYSNDEEKQLKGLAEFLIDHGYVAKTRSDRYYSISFKYGILLNYLREIKEVYD